MWLFFPKVIVTQDGYKRSPLTWTRGLYEAGWAQGKISYYNLKFGKYKVDLKSDSDYIGHEEIDGVELILV